MIRKDISFEYDRDRQKKKEKNTEVKQEKNVRRNNETTENSEDVVE